MSLGGLSIQEKVMHLIFLIDTSGSMAANAKIQSLNAALEEVMPALRHEAAELVGIDPHVRVVAFSSQPRWVQEAPQPLENFWWQDIAADARGLTELGLALDFVRRSLDQHEHGLPPAIVLLTDGMPTDTFGPTFLEGLQRLDAHPVGRVSTRAAIAIGSDADIESLESFVAAANGEVVAAVDPQELTAMLRAAGSSVLRRASELAS